jgi:hypothetical protein
MYRFEAYQSRYSNVSAIGKTTGGTHEKNIYSFRQLGGIHVYCSHNGFSRRAQNTDKLEQE